MNRIKQLKKSIAIMRKNLKIYYLKGPVIIFGMLIPLFFFLAFWLGREMSSLTLGAGLVGMSIWFTSTSISPVITPWETRTGTLGRLVSSPIKVSWVLFGDILASALVGIIISFVPLIITIFILNLSVLSPVIIIISLVLGSLCFSSIGVLMASLPTDTPSDVMMLSSLVKFPLVFISGIFIPIKALPGWGQVISKFSPLTYLTTLIRGNIGSETITLNDSLLNIGVLVVFLIFFTKLAVVFHKRTLPGKL